MSSFILCEFVWSQENAKMFVGCLTTLWLSNLCCYVVGLKSSLYVYSSGHVWATSSSVMKQLNTFWIIINNNNNNYHNNKTRKIRPGLKINLIILSGAPGLVAWMDPGFLNKMCILFWNSVLYAVILSNVIQYTHDLFINNIKETRGAKHFTVLWWLNLSLDGVPIHSVLLKGWIVFHTLICHLWNASYGQCSSLQSAQLSQIVNSLMPPLNFSPPSKQAQTWKGKRAFTR